MKAHRTLLPVYGTFTGLRVQLSSIVNDLTHLEERVARNDAQESLEPFSPCLNDFVGEAVGEYFAR